MCYSHIVHSQLASTCTQYPSPLMNIWFCSFCTKYELWLSNVFFFRSFVPKSFLDKKAKKEGDHSLIPSRRAITITQFHAHSLKKALEKILAPIGTLEKPESFFGKFTPPKNSVVHYCEEGTELVTEKDKKSEVSTY